MGRSKSNSCFKIIACGGDSVETDDLQAPELQSKSSSEKRWSFRKKSARHRVLSSSVISENQTANKESPESASLGFQPQETSAVQEKISVIEYTDEKTQLPVSTKSKSLEMVFAAMDESEVEVEDHLDESVVIVIQTAVRGFLAKRELLKLKNVIKLQAAIRGHLVRQHAVGTLRCVQAIVKMQLLVRARQARLLQEKNLDGVNSKKRKNSSTKQNYTYISIEKLLSNSFARQLMESTPRNNPIHIKCDPSNQNSAWNWLERWMAVSSAEPTPKPEPLTEEVELQKGNSTSPTETDIASDVHYELENSVSGPKEILLSESDKNLNNFDVPSNKELSSLDEGSLEQSEPESEKILTSDAKEVSVDSNSALGERIKSGEKLQIVSALPHKSEREAEQPNQLKRSMKRIASEELETEGKKFVYGSRKASNPAFIAAQSKFEELSSMPNSRSFHQDNGVESSTEGVISGLESTARTKESAVKDNSGTYISRGQFGGSECGTELSVTSTLDSPVITEVEVPEYEREAKLGKDDTPSIEKKQDFNANDESKDPVSTLSSPGRDQPEKLDSDKGEPANSVLHPDSSLLGLQQQRSTPNVHGDLDTDISVPVYRSSPEASPGSHMTVPESHGTPSSQVSVNAKTNRAEKSGSSQKRKSVSSEKKHDYGARNSTEQLRKDEKSGKRRNSYGSPKPETPDLEPRDSSSNSSLPHFMQATESARAKLLANSSPISSPDVHDRDHIKKRHSLPGANGRQGSPRIQRSASQAQPGAKGFTGPVVHDKKWQR